MPMTRTDPNPRNGESSLHNHLTTGDFRILRERWETALGLKIADRTSPPLNAMTGRKTMKIPAG
jgi:hypothetical protein